MLILIRKIIFIATVFATTCFTIGCDSKINLLRDEISSKIENEIKLPKGSLHLESYSRYYYGDPRKIVRGVYTVFPENFKENVKHTCVRLNITNYPCTDDNFGVILPGERKWIENESQLPAQDGGGCAHIIWEFDAVRGIFNYVECNGEY